MALTDADIEAAMERAVGRLRADRFRPQRVTVMPTQAADALAGAGADGWTEIGVIVDPDWPHDWRAWLHVETRAGRLRPWPREG